MNVKSFFSFFIILNILIAVSLTNYATDNFLLCDSIIELSEIENEELNEIEIEEATYFSFCIFKIPKFYIKNFKSNKKLDLKIFLNQPSPPPETI